MARRPQKYWSNSYILSYHNFRVQTNNKQQYHSCPLPRTQPLIVDTAAETINYQNEAQLDAWRKTLFIHACWQALKPDNEYIGKVLVHSISTLYDVMTPYIFNQTEAELLVELTPGQVSSRAESSSRRGLLLRTVYIGARFISTMMTDCNSDDGRRLRQLVIYSDAEAMLSFWRLHSFPPWMCAMNNAWLTRRQDTKNALLSLIFRDILFVNNSYALFNVNTKVERRIRTEDEEQGSRRKLQRIDEWC